VQVGVAGATFTSEGAGTRVWLLSFLRRPEFQAAVSAPAIPATSFASPSAFCPRRR